MHYPLREKQRRAIESLLSGTLKGHNSSFNEWQPLLIELIFDTSRWNEAHVSLQMPFLTWVICLSFQLILICDAWLARWEYHLTLRTILFQLKQRHRLENALLESEWRNGSIHKRSFNCKQICSLQPTMETQRGIKFLVYLTKCLVVARRFGSLNCLNI